jgi:hypothetical protein
MASDLTLCGLSGARSAAILFLLDRVPMVGHELASPLASVAFSGEA